MVRPSLILFAAVCSLAVLPGEAAAHTNSVCNLRLEVEGEQVRLTLVATRRDLAPTLGVSEGVNPVPGLYRQKRQTVLTHVAAYISVASGGTALCALTDKELELPDPERVRIQLTYRCPRRVELLELKYDLMFDDDSGHKALLAVGRPGHQARGAVLTSDRRLFTLEREVSAWRNAADFLVLGLEHIFGGPDHLLFLVGLLLAAGLCGRGREARPRGLGQGLRYLLKVVTAFTVAHSLTLMGAALGLVSLPPRVVEPAIALSIVYVGLENLLLGDPRRRWLIAGLFGLVHGFGFAYILGEVGLPRSGLILSLVSFNLGVEAGQIALVALLFPLLHLLAQWRHPRWSYRLVLLRGGSVIIVGAGLFWLVQRVLSGIMGA